MMRCVFFILWVTALTTFTLPLIWALEGQALSIIPFAWCVGGIACAARLLDPGKAPH